MYDKLISQISNNLSILIFKRKINKYNAKIDRSVNIPFEDTTFSSKNYICHNGGSLNEREKWKSRGRGKERETLPRQLPVRFFPLA